MLVALLMLAIAWLDERNLLILGGILIICKLVAIIRTHRLELHYSHSNPLFKEFVAKTDIARMKFQHYILSPTPAPQGIIYLIVETLHAQLCPDKFERELLTLDDGGTIGLDWDGDIPDPNAEEKQPILIICPGLGGGSHNLYNLSLLWMARAAGYKCCTVLFRGGAGLPITTPVLSYSGSWRDAKHAFDYVRKTYGCD